MNMRKRKGFTLIELLVVIAIIGILAAAVLGNLNEARKKGKDASIKSNLAGIRSSAEIYFDTNGNYNSTTNAVNDSTCNAQIDNTFIRTGSVVNALLEAGSQSPGNVKCTINGTGTEYAVATALNAGNYWCVDSSGASLEIANLIADNDTTCN